MPPTDLNVVFRIAVALFSLASCLLSNHVYHSPNRACSKRSNMRTRHQRATNRRTVKRHVRRPPSSPEPHIITHSHHSNTAVQRFALLLLIHVFGRSVTSLSILSGRFESTRHLRNPCDLAMSVRSIDLLGSFTSLSHHLSGPKDTRETLLDATCVCVHVLTSLIDSGIDSRRRLLLSALHPSPETALAAKASVNTTGQSCRLNNG